MNYKMQHEYLKLYRVIIICLQTSVLISATYCLDSEGMFQFCTLSVH